MTSDLGSMLESPDRTENRLFLFKCKILLSAIGGII